MFSQESMEMDVVVRVVLVLAISGVGTASAWPAEAQVPSAELAIRGVVLDSSRGVVAGARIEAASAADAQEVSTISDRNGAFTLTVKAGRYRLRILANGFSILEQTVAAASA